MRFGPRRVADPGARLAIGAGLLLFARTPVDGSYVADLLPRDDPARHRRRASASRR